MKLSLETHQICVYLKNKRKANALPLWNIDGHGLTFNGIFNGFIQWLDFQDFANNDTKRVFSFFSKNATIGNNIVFQSGQFEYGEFGVANSIKDVHTRKVTHPKTREEAEVYPLYFGLLCPKDYSRGLFVLQRYGQNGMLNQLKNTISNYMNENHDDFIVKIEPCIPIEILLAYVNQGTVTDVILSRSHLPSDIDSQLRENGFINDPKSVKVTFTGGNTLLGKDKLISWLKGEQRPSIIVESLKSLGIDEYADLKIVVNVNGNDHTIDLSNVGRIRPYKVLNTDGLIDASTGHPIFSELNRIAKLYAQDILTPGVREN
jgi:hypothetical protein